MVRVEGQRIIRAPVHKVFQLVSRLDAQPQVTGLWLTADLLERRSNTLTVQYRGYLAGLPVESVQHAILQPPHRVEFRQTRGGFKTFRGSYTLKPIEGDTELALTVEADVGISLIGDTAARQVLLAYVERSLDKFKLMAERELARPGRRAQEEATAPSPPSPAPSSESVPTPGRVAPSPSGPAPRRRRRRRRRRHPAGQPKKMSGTPEQRDGKRGASTP